MTLLEVKDITKRFKKIEVVKDLSFNVDEGEIVGLLGEIRDKGDAEKWRD